MFYKRISDLHPLGKPSGTPPSWNNLTPFEIAHSGEVISTTVTQASIPSTGLNGQYGPWGSASNVWPLKESSFPLAQWNGISNGSDQYISTTTTYVNEDPSLITSEYYNKALWFEVAVSKNHNGVPTSKRHEIDKYHTKRLNAHLLFTNIDELCATSATIDCLSATNVTATYVSTNVLSSNEISTDNITAIFGDISVVHADSISCNVISVDNGVVTNISGTNLYYDNGTIDEFQSTDICCTNITAYGVAQLTAAAAYWADLAELYESDENYGYGTLVKFGGKKEITIADDKANAVISEKPAILMNNSLGTDEFAHALPIVLIGRSKVRVLNPIKKFEKICLSTTPGVAVGENADDNFKASTIPLGIALESSDNPKEKMIECILQLSLE